MPTSRAIGATLMTFTGFDFRSLIVSKGIGATASYHRLIGRWPMPALSGDGSRYRMPATS